jgi:hypothetical protein
MRFSGAVGYATNAESVPGVWTEVFTVKTYYGDFIQYSSRSEPPLLVPPTLNGNVGMQISLSIVADAYAYANFSNIRYVTWRGQAWRVSNVAVQRPRLILTIGELWNGKTA